MLLSLPDTFDDGPTDGRTLPRKMTPPPKRDVRSEKKARAKQPPAAVLGWREWAALPDLGVEAIKVKLDTGARTSSLHAFELEHHDRDGTLVVRFEIHPHQRSRDGAVPVEAEVVDERWVRNSGGERELRPVIETTVKIGDRSWPIELTLTRRDQMGFRMLLGRQALRKRATVDPGSSFRAGRRPSGQKKKTTKKKTRTTTTKTRKRRSDEGPETRT